MYKHIYCECIEFTHIIIQRMYVCTVYIMCIIYNFPFMSILDSRIISISFDINHTFLWVQEQANVTVVLLEVYAFKTLGCLDFFKGGGLFIPPFFFCCLSIYLSIGTQLPFYLSTAIINLSFASFHMHLQSDVGGARQGDFFLKLVGGEIR